MYLLFSDHTDKNMNQILCQGFARQGSECDFCICGEVKKQYYDYTIFPIKTTKSPHRHSLKKFLNGFQDELFPTFRS